MHVWALGASHNNPRTLNGTFDGPGASKHHQKTTRRHRERETKRAKMEVGQGKKSTKFWGPPFGPHPSGLDPSGSGPNFFWVWAPPFGAMTHTQIQMANNGLAKIGLAQIGLAKIGVGQNWPGQNHDSQKWIGQNWSSHSCSPLAHSKKSPRCSSQVNSCALSWTTCTLRASLVESGSCTIDW